MMMGGERGLTGRHVLGMLVAFFLIVFAANGAFIYLALESHSGVAEKDAYRKGLAYDETLSRAAAQRALGWRVSVDVQASEGGADVVVIARDAAGRELEGLAVKAIFARPVGPEHDRTIALAAARGGRYQGFAPLRLKGQWDLVLVLDGGADRRWRQEQRIWLK